MMVIWILVALAGALLSLAGFWAMLQKYRRGDIRGRYLLALIVGFIAFVAWALLSNLRPGAVDGVLELLMLAPALIAIIVIIREHQTLHYR
jgi:hypothetical protein